MRNRKELLILLFIVSAVIIGVVIYNSRDEEAVAPPIDYIDYLAEIEEVKTEEVKKEREEVKKEIEEVKKEEFVELVEEEEEERIIEDDNNNVYKSDEEIYLKALNEYTITNKVIINYPDLIVLIMESKSLKTHQEKQNWFNLLPMMNEEQIDKLYDILRREKQKIQEIEERYERKKQKIIEKYNTN